MAQLTLDITGPFPVARDIVIQVTEWPSQKEWFRSHALETTTELYRFVQRRWQLHSCQFQIWAAEGQIATIGSLHSSGLRYGSIVRVLRFTS